MTFDPTKKYWQALSVFSGVHCNCTELYTTREAMLKKAKEIDSEQDHETDSLFYIYYNPEDGPSIGHFSGNDLWNPNEEE